MLDLGRCTAEYGLFASSVLPRHHQHFETLHLSLSAYRNYLFPPPPRKAIASSNKITTVDIEMEQGQAARAGYFVDVTTRAMNYMSGVLGPFADRNVRLRLAALNLDDTIGIARLFPRVQHLTLKGQCLSSESPVMPHYDLVHQVSKMTLESLELDRTGRYNLAESNPPIQSLHHAWTTYNWTTHTSLTSLTLLGPTLSPSDWTLASQFAPQLLTLSLTFTSSPPLTLPPTPFPSLSILTLTLPTATLLTLLSLLSSSPLKSLSLSFRGSYPPLPPPSPFLPSLTLLLPTLKSLDCSMLTPDPTPTKTWIGDAEADAIESVCREGKCRFLCDGWGAEEWRRDDMRRMGGFGAWWSANS